MIRLVRSLSIIILFVLTFIYTEKASYVIKEHDHIMIEIKENAESNYFPKIEAIIKNDTIIPGIHGKKVNIEKSYEKMKLIGVYNDEYLVFDRILVINSLDKCKDKYIISGNTSKKALSIIYEINDNKNLNKILKLIKKYNIKISFFIDGVWLENNRDKFYEIIDEGYEFGSVGYNGMYDDSSYIWVDNVIKIATNSNKSYCLEKDTESLNICKNINNYTLRPIIINKNPFISTKNNLNNGAILYYKDSESFINEFEIIIKYLNSKEYEILTVSKLLEE